MRDTEWPDLQESTTLLLIRMLTSEEEKLVEFLRSAIDFKTFSVDLCFQIGSSSVECVETVGDNLLPDLLKLSNKGIF